jgi:membrane-associated protein
VLTALLDAAAALPVPVVLGVAAALLVVESGTLVGMVLPGTTVLVALGLWSHAVPDALPAAVAVAAPATVAGAHLGWWRGRTGPIVRAQLTGRLGRLVRTPAERARRWLAGRGPVATAALLACGHWAAAARPVMPRVAGGAGVPYRVVGPAVAVSGTAWAATLVLLGNRIGAHVLAHAGWLPVVVVGLLIVALAVRGRRASPTVAERS